MNINAQETALLLIGFQKDYFAPSGVLRDVVEDSSQLADLVSNTVNLLQHLEHSSVSTIATPIFFTSDYEELVEPIGILKKIKEVRAFQMGNSGSAMIEELQPFRDRILVVPGRRGFNAFIDTDLHQICQDRGIKNIALTGAIASVCIDSTGRYAQEQNYCVTILSDCISARTSFEHEFYFKNIFPLYAEVMTSHQFLAALNRDAAMR
ncbi:cysteine hydrolase family protein [Leptolyngbya boryana CZ1]|uniref:Cysteine hydrolase family protein n=1 Tax=Leptolyngbya boryana CZ1 TaxID=3060204 RepID=A0AA97ALG6_LEPBY|nr:MULTISPECIES: cysteine hydrolase family protein [Leptolyngbya]WNZ43342.1 cysteine hydrolase family protein [Leptolyngbya boryana CZ1]